MTSTRAWARDLIRRSDWIVLDTESTGLGSQAELIEIALVAADGSVLFDELLRPRGPIPQAIQKVHGLSEKELRCAPDLGKLRPALDTFLRNRKAIAFHAPFDRALLARSYRQRGLILPTMEWECALDRYEDWRGFRCSLQTACEIEGIPVGTLHRAAADALLLWKLLLHMAGEAVP